QNRCQGIPCPIGFYFFFFGGIAVPISPKVWLLLLALSNTVTVADTGLGGSLAVLGWKASFNLQFLLGARVEWQVVPANENGAPEESVASGLLKVIVAPPFFGAVLRS